MKEYEELGHMQRAPHHQYSTLQSKFAHDNRDTEMTLAHDALASGGLRVSEDRLSKQTHAHPPYYLPHHGVLREDRITTKLRVVFNGSSPTTLRISLNDIQHVGAKIQRDISDMLIWIRQHSTTKFYKDDWDLQRIMWIDDQLNIVPLIKGRYVDDIFGGADQLDALIETSNQVTQLCKAGGLPLAKWHSNNKQFVEHIDHDSSSHSHSFEDSNTKLLGLSWIPHTDVFKFSSKPPCSSFKLTKRIILSETAQLYDPLGFLTPLIIRAKSLMQELWIEKINWDTQVPESLHTKWASFRQELTQVDQITISRWTQLTTSSTVELHGFSDASQIAMAAAIYIKSTTPGEESKVTLICAKSKVAPLKRLSIPRLELTAALILAKLMKYVQTTLELTNAHTFLWTDSSVTLTWINSHPSRWKDFVRNRVSAIQDLTPNSVWRFVPGKENPADSASRGVSISQLQKHPLWWTGPQWLTKEQPSWPTQHYHQDSQTHQEERPRLAFTVATTQVEYHWEMIYRQSSLLRLLRVTAICFRVSQLIKKLPNSTLVYHLSPQDIERARVFCIKATQAAYFSQEIKLINSAQLPSAHSFNRLTTYIDTQGIIRVGGRLINSQLELEAIHPAILPRHSYLTTLIIANAHHKTMHGGTQLTLNQTRQSYWIIGGRAPVRSHILRCVKCARQRGLRAQQLMGQLPTTRVTSSRPFYYSGVDYAGPLTIKTWKGRGAKHQKGWLCIFVCFVTSALHLEAVSDYSTDSFIAAFRRFTGRRGIYNTLHSDCGTNFSGADATLTKLFTQGTIESNLLACSLTNDGTTWKFNPPSAPHMGGKWEAAVKSVKYHLSRTIGDIVLTYEELSTLLTQIEAVLNSRPLEPLTEDPEDISALTPAHFLIGEPITTIPEPSLIALNINRLS